MAEWASNCRRLKLWRDSSGLGVRRANPQMGNPAVCISHLFCFDKKIETSPTHLGHLSRITSR